MRLVSGGELPIRCVHGVQFASHAKTATLQTYKNPSRQNDGRCSSEHQGEPL